MLSINGMLGEGGGQILRTSLALSLVTGNPFIIKEIRAGRKKPGLMRQHLTCVNAAVKVGNAKAEGANIGSQSLKFEPRAITPGKYNFAIGTAGSCTLVLQAILPALLVADGPSEVILEGGTHNPFAPPFDFLDQTFLRLINEMGPTVSASLIRPGFYPAGGGKIKVEITPSPLGEIDLTQRGEILNKTAKAFVANLPENIAAREIKIVKKLLGWEDCEIVNIPYSHGPGNVLTLSVESENLTEVFTGFGVKGVTAEKVAKRCVGQVKSYLAADAPVGKHLADQLLIPLAMAGGGTFITQPPSRHTMTNIEVVKQFLDLNINCAEIDERRWQISVEK
ncbi:RNA 3'-terminal phosphate cyclase [Desulfobacter curvatus]|uniref:RNA 3'-terminal phosphate cyclase n=1 Tax=Desulfobacter curvatus TaxID=2290 RepID=UPI00037632A1|nr:RNA 3'-terminal phosphate cyclase [Desulfobacter curvatus]